MLTNMPGVGGGAWAGLLGNGWGLGRYRGRRFRSRCLGESAMMVLSGMQLGWFASYGRCMSCSLLLFLLSRSSCGWVLWWGPVRLTSVGSETVLLVLQFLVSPAGPFADKEWSAHHYETICSEQCSVCLSVSVLPSFRTLLSTRSSGTRRLPLLHEDSLGHSGR